nr:hypothetical protein [Tanacetum cinerariifolium]
VKNDTVCNEKVSNVFRKEREQYFESQDLRSQLQDKNIVISELKKLIEKGKGKSVDTKFDRPFVVRKPNAQWILKPSVLGKPTPFSNSLERIYFLKTMSVSKANVLEGLSKPVTAQTLPQTTRKAVSNTNVLKPGMYRIDNRKAHTRAPHLPHTVGNTNPHVSTSTGVNQNTNVSRPQLKSNQSRYKVVPNNSQVKVKKTQVEVHPKIPSVSNKMKYVTACKDSLNSRTLNVNAVYATISPETSKKKRKIKKKMQKQAVQDNFDDDSRKLKLSNGDISITPELVYKFLGVPLGGEDINRMNRLGSEDVTSLEWHSQFSRKNPTPKKVYAKIQESRMGGILFNLNFLSLFLNAMGLSEKGWTM